jgi:hypothetical protein
MGGKELFTRRYIVIRIVDANPVSGPMSYYPGPAQFSTSQRTCDQPHSQVCRRESKDQVDKKDGKTGLAKVKSESSWAKSTRGETNKNTESNLVVNSTRTNVTASGGDTHVTMLIFAENHRKNNLMKRVSVLSSTATG